jgi:hypothetical protein
MARDLKLRDPVRPLTQSMLAWASELEIVDLEVYPLPGGQQRRTWAPDPRLVHLKASLSAKSTDVVTYYNHIAALRHKKDGLVFVVFRETKDALLARQTDSERFPLWLMDSPVKNTELQTFYAVVTQKPRPGMASPYDWLAPIEERFPNGSWIEDVLSYTLIKNRVAGQDFYGTRPA